MPELQDSPKALILVGGPGTRLQPLTNDTPKPMVPVLNRPFLEYTLAYLRRYGIDDVILTLSYLPDVIRGYFGDGSRFGVRLTYCLEETPLGTAGAVKNAEKFLKSTFLVLNGDIFTDLDIAGMLARHRQKGAWATISLNWVDNPGAFGVVETDSDQRVRRFIEKPPPGEETTNWINAGTYILEPEVLQYIPPDQHYMVERGLFPRLLELGKPVYGYPFSGYWLDMGNPQKYLSLNGDLLSSKASNPLPPVSGGEGIIREPDVIIHPSATLVAPAVIGSGSRIGRGVTVKGPAVIGRGCRLEEGASIENAVLWDSVSIGSRASISHSIIGNNINIARGARVANNVITASETVPLA